MIGAHLNEVVQKVGNFSHKCANKKKIVFQKMML